MYVDPDIEPLSVGHTNIISNTITMFPCGD